MNAQAASRASQDHDGTLPHALVPITVCVCVSLCKDFRRMNSVAKQDPELSYVNVVPTLLGLFNLDADHNGDCRISACLGS